MRLMTGRNHPNFDLDGGMPQGPKTVIRAARDPIAPEPEDPQIQALLQRTLCHAILDREEQRWEVRSVIGTVDYVPYGGTYDDWVKTCEALLAEAMDHG